VLGSNPEVIREKVIDLLNTCGPSTGLFHEYEYKLAKKISDLVPSVEMFRMLGSGTEADMVASRIARLKTGNKNILKMILYVIIGHCKADESDERQVSPVKTLSPVGRNVTAFHNQVLPVLNGGPDDFTDDWPQIFRKRVIVFRFQIRVSAADQSHLKVIDGKIRIVVLFEHSLCQKRFSGVRRSCYQNNHNSFPSQDFLSASHSTPEAC
jgi:hypothetical protein